MGFVIEAESIEDLSEKCQEFLGAIGADTKSVVAAAKKGSRKSSKDAAAVAGAPIDPATVPQPIAPPPGVPSAGNPTGQFAPPPAVAQPQAGVPDFSGQLTSPPAQFQAPAFAAPAAPQEAPEITACRAAIDRAVQKHGIPAIYDNYIHKQLGLQPGFPFDAFKAQILGTLAPTVIAQLSNALAAA
jgi:hypothetical protein